MTKAELISEVARNTRVRKTTVSKVIESLITNIQTSIQHGDNVYIRGFGSFIVKRRAEKIARNIKKNTQVVVPAHDEPAFRPSDKFKNLLK